MNLMINWYPGHMKKTREMIIENLKLVDFVIEILDARIPFSSKNPEINKIINEKKRLLILNKSDLANKQELKQWQNYFLDNNITDYFLEISVEKNENINELRKIIDHIYEEKLKKMQKKGLKKTIVRALVLGIPNVGKSKFINKFSNKNKAKVGNKPGFTRGKQWISVNEKFEMLDTPGILWPKFEDKDVSYNLAITGSIKDDILPIEEVCKKFLEIMKNKNIIDNLINIYKLDVDTLSNKNNEEILELLEKRLGIHKVENTNFEIISRKILKEYRIGKYGKFLLELPEERRKNEF